jgi:hypothetical protein
MRRCVWIRLLPPCERPWTREPNQFRHPCLIDYVKRHRARLVWAALTLVQNWLAAGRPSFSGRPLGSFEAWSRIMGGILQTAGITGFLENQNEFYESADEDSLAARCFVRVMVGKYQTQPVLAADLVSLAKDCELLSAHRRTRLVWRENLAGGSPGTKVACLIATVLRERAFSNGQSCGDCLPQKERARHTAPATWTTGAGDVDDMFDVDGLPQADGSPLAGDGDSVPAFTRGGTNSQNSQNSPERIYENPEPNIYENRRSELSEFREFLSPSEKGAPQITGDTTESRSDDVSP